MAGEQPEPEIRISAHALRQMFARAITMDEVREVATSGEAIAEYPDDRPHPSRLLLGFPSGRPIHVVLARETDDSGMVVVTTYQPDPDLWKPGFRERKPR